MRNHEIPLAINKHMCYNKSGIGGVNMEQKICPVDVISVCTTSGEIRPLRIQMEDETHQLLRINIEEVVSVRQIEHVGVEASVFMCRATVWDRKWLFELKYSIRSHTWSVLGRLH